MVESTAAFVAFVAFLMALAAPQGAATPPDAAATPHEPRVHQVASGLPWHLVARDAKPGDVITLEVGVHINGRIEDLHGTRERPIIIRGDSHEMPSAIKCEETGLELIRCSWVRVENLYFMNPREAAIVIDGTVPAPADAPAAPDADRSSDVSIAVAACHVAAERQFPGLDAVRVINARNVGVADCRFDAWSDAGIDVRGSSAVMIVRSRFVPTQRWLHPVAIRAGAGCQSIVAFQNVFDGDIGTGVEIGACVPDGDALTAANAGSVQVTRCVFGSVHAPISIAGRSTGSVEHCTIVDPKHVYVVDARCGSPRLSIANSIIDWEAGRLSAPVERRGDVTPEMVDLGENLWWSEELPMFFEAAGKPFGVERAPQIIDLDPRLDRKTLWPAAAAAMRFGWTAPLPPSPGTAAPSEAPPSPTLPSPPSPVAPPQPPPSPAENPAPRE